MNIPLKKIEYLFIIISTAVAMGLGAIILFIVLFLSGAGENKPITNPKDYTQAINSIKQQDKISHFPKNIPAEAEDVQLYCYTSDLHGELFQLRFKINKEYIKNELKKYSFINTDTKIGIRQNIYHMPFMNKEDLKNFTFYVLKNQENEYFFDEYFPYSNGIGISKNMDYIMYYYIEPGD